MPVDVVRVTPELAATWLAANTHNRNMRPTRVRAFADDIAAGRWVPNGETIKFTADGVLIDGQHRLAAIVSAGVSVDLLVVRGLPMSAQETIDTGATRTFGDVLSLRGEQRAAALAATCRIVYEWQVSGGTLPAGHTANPTHAQLSDVLAQHPELRHATTVGQRISYNCPPMPTSLGSLLVWLFERIDLDDANGFVEAMVTGANLATDSPILALRSLLKNYADRSNVRPDRRMLAGSAIKAWNAYRAGVPLRQVTFRPGGAHPERFPEPK